MTGRLTLAEWWSVAEEVDRRLNEQADAAFADEIARAKLLAEPARNAYERCTCWAKTQVFYAGPKLGYQSRPTDHRCKIHG